MQLDASINLVRASGFHLEVDLTIKPTGITALYGPSGSGKSTLLRLLAGLERGRPGDQIRIASNQCIWQDQHHYVPVHQRNIGFVFQQPQLFPNLTVRGNLDYAIKRRRRDPQLSLQTVVDWLGLASLLDAGSAQLSGGEAQRVAMARVLLNGADCLLMDEPLGALDQAARRHILPYIDRLRRLQHIPIVYVSHALDEVTYLADEIYMIDEGRIKASGSVFALASSLVLNSTEGEQVAAVVEATMDAQDADYGLSRLTLGSQSIHVSACDLAPGNGIRLRIPARDVSLALQPPQQTSILNVLQGVVTEIEPVSSSPVLLVRIKIDEQFILSRITRKSLVQLELQPGMQVYAQIKTVALLSEPTQQEPEKP